MGSWFGVNLSFLNSSHVNVVIFNMCCMYMRVGARAHARACVYVCVNAFVCVCVCVYACVSVCDEI